MRDRRCRRASDGRASYKGLSSPRSVPIAAQYASLGLFALIIDFTFAMTLTLYEACKKAVPDEANAIRTTALRAGMLPEPDASEVRDPLRDYV
jgi:hypothetical protein